MKNKLILVFIATIFEIIFCNDVSAKNLGEYNYRGGLIESTFG